MKRLSPLTVFFAPNDAFENKVIKITEISGTLLENHIFKDLLWCEKLVGMAGQRIESHNGQTWLVSVNAAGFPCFDTIVAKGGSALKACITECDILARNGIVHELDTVLIYESLDTRPPSPPIAPIAPINQQPTSPSFSRPKFPSPTPEDDGEDVDPGASNGSGASSRSLALVAVVTVIPMLLCLIA
jgi:hypothetical protein